MSGKSISKLHRYLDDTRRQGAILRPRSIVLSLLPWAGNKRYHELLHWDLPA